jgi:hypothetical protein
MFLRLLTILLVVVQLLVPPGICICHFLPSAAPAHTAVDDDDDQACCACCRRSSPRPTHQHKQEKHSNHHGKPDNHVPCCPALHQTDASLAPAADPLALLALVAEVNPDRFSAPGMGTVFPIEPDTGPTAQRLYLTFCTLLI